MSLKADLHCHSYYSDGKHSPEFLCQRAIARGVTHLAITDHDCLAAYRELTTIDDLILIPGVELSTDWQGKEIHVVGLGIDTENQALLDLISEQQARRRERLAEFNARLAVLGIHGLNQYMETQPCQAYTRTHVADFLVDNGHSKSHQKAFKKFLSRKGKIYVPAEWSGLQEAVQVLRAAGGIAVLAHPGRYPLSRSKLQNLIHDFKAAGGEALEVSYGNIDPGTRKKLLDLSESFELFASQGSDFHSEHAHWTDLGRFPELGSSAKKNAIWLHPRWHFS